MVHVYPEHLGITRCGYHCFQNKIETIKVSAQKKSVGGLNARFAGLKNRLPAPVLSSFISSVISTSFPWSNSLIYLAQRRSSPADSVALYPIATNVTFSGFSMLIYEATAPALTSPAPSISVAHAALRIPLVPAVVQWIMVFP